MVILKAWSKSSPATNGRAQPSLPSSIKTGTVHHTASVHPMWVYALYQGWRATYLLTWGVEYHKIKLSTNAAGSRSSEVSRPCGANVI